MFPKNNLEKKLHVQIATSTIMDNAINLWMQMYQNHPPWLGGKEETKSLNYPAAIAEEMARLVLTEFEIDITGSPRADFIKTQLGHTLDNMSNIVEMWCVLGGIVIKPYASGTDGATGNPNKIRIDVVQANRFYPTAFTASKEITGAVFVDTKRTGRYMYTRLEYHNLVGTTYTIVNRAFKSERLNTLTTEDEQVMVQHPLMEEIPLGTVDEWKGLEPETKILNMEKPLFTYIKMPRANNIDPHSPLGTSVFARAVEIIREADLQYSRILWEYEATEAAIDADESLFESDKRGHAVLPTGKKRLYRTYSFEDTNQSGFLKNFGPNIRDESLFNGLNELTRKIELLCGLTYGTLSEPGDVERTATEIKASKQRSYTTINAMQKAWDAGLDDVIRIMDTLCTLYNMVPAGNVEKVCTWGDGVLEDTEAEYQRRWAMVLSGKLRVEKFFAWYFGCSEDEARELIPQENTYPPVE